MRLGLLLLLSTTPALASDPAPAKALDTVWLLIAAFLVFFMQAGFAMVEAGFTRAKNATNIMMKNLMDFSAGSVAFFVVGFGLMFGADFGGFVGTSDFFVQSGDPATPAGQWQLAWWMFQAVFAATAATIASGAMAGRTKFASYLVYSVLITAFIYPIVGHWIWGGGWLQDMGMIDFAGSTVVHSVGAWAGLVGAWMLGPRTGKFVERDGRRIARAMPGHNVPIGALGVFILWFGWFGFNAGSTASGTTLSIASIAVTTNLSAAAGAIAAMALSWKIHHKPDIGRSLNGALAGLVAITAGCAVVSPISALFIGAAAGILVVLGMRFIEERLHIDDPVGAVAVHGLCGAWGTLAVGLFAEARIASAAGVGEVSGLFFGGGAGQLGVQALGVLAVAAWSLGTCWVMFTIIKRYMGLRVDVHHEEAGLDRTEHGVDAYAGFGVPFAAEPVEAPAADPLRSLDPALND